MGAQSCVCANAGAQELGGAGCGDGDGKDGGWDSVGCGCIVVNVDGGIFGVMCCGGYVLIHTAT